MQRHKDFAPFLGVATPNWLLELLRLACERAHDDVLTIEAVRKQIGDDISLMVDFNQGLDFAEALERCHLIDDFNLAWIEEPIVYNNMHGYIQLTNALKTPVQIGEDFYGPQDSLSGYSKESM